MVLEVKFPREGSEVEINSQSNQLSFSWIELGNYVNDVSYPLENTLMDAFVGKLPM